MTTITTRNGGKTEVLSGLQYPAREVPSTAPLFIVENASASFSYGTESFWIGGDYQIQVRETRGGLTREFRSSLSSYPVKALPRNNGSMVPLFSAIASASVTNGTYRLINKYSAKALDVSGVSTSDGAAVHQWAYVGGLNQKWQLAELSGADSGFFTITSVHSGKALDVWGASTADGSAIVQWSHHGGDNQKWRLDDDGDGYYRLVAKHSGKVVAIDGAGLGNGARAIQWTFGNSEGQKWQLLAP